MIVRKVRVGSVYIFDPVIMDRNTLPKGTVVKVVNLHGCPPANTMGMCYVLKENLEIYSEKYDGHWEFHGMVCTNSLVNKAEFERRTRNEQN